jgi:hypothetical protein
MKTQVKLEKEKQEKVERLYNTSAYNWAFNRAVKKIEEIATRNEPLESAFIQIEYKNLPKSLVLLYNSMVALLASEMIAEKTKDVVKESNVLND